MLQDSDWVSMLSDYGLGKLDDDSGSFLPTAAYLQTTVSQKLGSSTSLTSLAVPEKRVSESVRRRHGLINSTDFLSSESGQLQEVRI